MDHSASSRLTALTAVGVLVLLAVVLWSMAPSGPEAPRGGVNANASPVPLSETPTGALALEGRTRAGIPTSVLIDAEGGDGSPIDLVIFDGVAMRSERVQAGEAIEMLPGRYSLMARALGFGSVVTAFKLEHGCHVVQLRRARALRVRCADGGGAPIATLKLQIESVDGEQKIAGPSRDPIMEFGADRVLRIAFDRRDVSPNLLATEDRLASETDEMGGVEWTGIAGDRVALRVCSTRGVRSPGRDVVPSPGSSTLVVSLLPGQNDVEILLERATALRGSFAIPDGSTYDEAVATLRRVDISKEGATTERIEARAKVGANGTFVFADVLPGPKTLVVQAKRGDWHYIYARTQAVCLAGTETDVGVLVPEPATVSVDFRAVDTTTQSSVDLENSGIVWPLTIACNPINESATIAVTSEISDLKTVLKLSGVPEGLLSATITSPRVGKLPDEYRMVDGFAFREVRVINGFMNVNVVIGLEQFGNGVLVLQAPAVVLSAVASLRSPGTSRARQVRVVRGAMGLTGTTEVGRSGLSDFDCMAYSLDGESGYWGEGRVALGVEHPASMAMQPASALKFTISREALNGRKLVWVHIVRQHDGLDRVVTSGAGEVLVKGLVPDSSYNISIKDEQQVVLGAPITVRTGGGADVKDLGVLASK